ncbi:hypothetical protein EBZ80_15000, partial [bacterium]|nr:hypothetical protein [bacterium]
MRAGMSSRAACKHTLELVGLACFLTSFTTAIGMGSLGWASHEIVREFGWSCVIGVILTWISVMLLIPLACATSWGKRFTRGAEKDFLDRSLDRGLDHFALNWRLHRGLNRGLDDFALSRRLDRGLVVPVAP